MSDRERRQPVDIQRTAKLREGLTPEQQAVLPTLEQFRWRVEFVRRPLFRAPLPVLSDRTGNRLVVLEADGSINESPDIQVRARRRAGERAGQDDERSDEPSDRTVLSLRR